MGTQEDVEGEKPIGVRERITNALLADSKTGKVEFTPLEQVQHSVEANVQAFRENASHAARALADGIMFHATGDQASAGLAIKEAREFAVGELTGVPQKLEEVVARDRVSKAVEENVSAPSDSRPTETSFTASPDSIYAGQPADGLVSLELPRQGQALPAWEMPIPPSDRYDAKSDPSFTTAAAAQVDGWSIPQAPDDVRELLRTETDVEPKGEATSESGPSLDRKSNDARTEVISSNSSNDYGTSSEKGG